jgi:hypothetical protein
METIVRIVNVDIYIYIYIYKVAKSIESHSFGRPRRKRLQKC